MPVALETSELLESTLQAVESLQSSHAIFLVVVCNRLTIIPLATLMNALRAVASFPILVSFDPHLDRGVAGAWNHGIQLLNERGAEYIGIVANDTLLKTDCLDLLVAFGKRTPNADLWSAISTDAPKRSFDEMGGLDFNCFMMRPATVETFGRFDENYWPAYFEDGDYFARVILGNGCCAVVNEAVFEHRRSLTIRRDRQAARRVVARMKANQEYFLKKWGVSQPSYTQSGVLTRYFLNPFGNASKPLSWFPQPACKTQNDR